MATTRPGVGCEVVLVRASTGAIPSPNIWRHPDVYEVLNRASDPDGLIEAALYDLRPWDGAHVVDIGCGTGYHLPGYARRAGRVTGVEPHAGLVRLARQRVRSLGNVEVLQGAAQRLPLPDASVDVIHARWAYFFGPGCEPGLREAMRVLRRGGVIALVDVDATRGEYGRWFRRAYPTYDPDEVDRFWARQGFSTQRLLVPWAFESRADLAAVLGIEFPPDAAAAALAEAPGTTIACGVAIRWRCPT